MALSSLFAGLVGCSSSKGDAIFSKIGMRQVTQIIKNLSTAVLSNQSILELENLITRLTSLNGKRNILVHGRWTMEIVVWGYKGSLHWKAVLWRGVEPDDFRDLSKVYDIRNQKERIRYLYNLKRIQGLVRDALILVRDIRSFQRRHPVLHRPDAAGGWQVSEWLRPLHQPARGALNIHFGRYPATPLESH